MEPAVERQQKQRKVDTAEVRRIPRQIARRAFEQGLGANMVAGRMVMKGDGHLDQPLNKSFFLGGIDGTPHVLPDLVSFKKLSVVEVLDSLVEAPKIHASFCHMTTGCSPKKIQDFIGDFEV